jgi:hypothetical protein
MASYAAALKRPSQAPASAPLPATPNEGSTRVWTGRPVGGAADARGPMAAENADAALRAAERLVHCIRERDIAPSKARLLSAAARAFQDRVGQLLGLECSESPAGSPLRPAGRPPGTRALWSEGKHRRRGYHLARTVKRQQDELRCLKERQSWTLTTLSLVQAGLSDPSASARATEEFGREFSPSVDSFFGRTSVCHIRHAMALTLKSLTANSARAYIARTAPASVVFRHLHDEASLRVRSFLSDVGTGPSEGSTRALTGPNEGST